MSYHHLSTFERGRIEELWAQGYSNRAIDRELNCSPTTVGNELCRGTLCRKNNKGRVPGYSKKRGQVWYRSNRNRSNKPQNVNSRTTFSGRVEQQVRERRWSLDVYLGYARLEYLF